MDQQEYERERGYHTRLLTDALLPQLTKMAKIRVMRAVSKGQIVLGSDGRDAVSGLSADDLSREYSIDSCRRFVQLFMNIPLKMVGAIDAKNDRAMYLSVPAPDGSMIPQEMIAQLSMVPFTYEYLGAACLEDQRSILDVSILETLDRYVAQQIRGAEIYWDVVDDGVGGDDVAMMDDDAMRDDDIAPTENMMFSVPWDLTREEIVRTFENIRDARRGG
jgi:hypothetical protein